MGMDLNIYSARNREVFKHEGWWDSEQVQEEFYSRKFWDLVNNCSFIPKDYESGEFIELTYENLEEMISVACKHPNYWGNYNDVPKLCKLRDKFFIYGWDDENDESIDGRKLYLEYDW